MEPVFLRKMAQLDHDAALGIFMRESIKQMKHVQPAAKRLRRNGLRKEIYGRIARRRTQALGANIIRVTVAYVLVVAAPGFRSKQIPVCRRIEKHGVEPQPVGNAVFGPEIEACHKSDKARTVAAVAEGWIRKCLLYRHHHATGNHRLKTGKHGVADEILLGDACVDAAFAKRQRDLSFRQLTIGRGRFANVNIDRCLAAPGQFLSDLRREDETGIIVKWQRDAH